jgi:hypothetical protein
MMRRLVILLSLVVIVLTLSGTSLLQARPAAARLAWIGCDPYTPPGICAPAFHQGDLLRIRSGVGFVWLRAGASSSAAVLGTVWHGLPNAGNLRVVESKPVFDGYQSWYVVSPLFNLRLRGWVEQASLEVYDPYMPTVIPPPQAKAEWQPPFAALLRIGVPFGWIRNRPSSYAFSVDTIYPLQAFTVTSNGAVFDGIQWWWPVHVTKVDSHNSTILIDGWLEQSSIRTTPSSWVPSPTPTANSITGPAAFQPFEAGYMVWTSAGDTIYVLYGLNGGSYTIYNTYAGLPDNPVPENPPPGLFKPIRGFGRVWGNFANVRTALGWGRAAESGYTATVSTQQASNGQNAAITVSLPDGRIAVLSRGAWNF